MIWLLKFQNVHHPFLSALPSRINWKKNLKSGLLTGYFTKFNNAYSVWAIYVIFISLFNLFIYGYVSTLISEKVSNFTMSIMLKVNYWNFRKWIIKFLKIENWILVPGGLRNRENYKKKWWFQVRGNESFLFGHFLKEMKQCTYFLKLKSHILLSFWAVFSGNIWLYFVQFIWMSVRGGEASIFF